MFIDESGVCLFSERENTPSVCYCLEIFPNSCHNSAADFFIVGGLRRKADRNSFNKKKYHLFFYRNTFSIPSYL